MQKYIDFEKTENSESLKKRYQDRYGDMIDLCQNIFFDSYIVQH